MARYSRTEAGEVVEHFDSAEEMEASTAALGAEGSYLGSFVLFVVGCMAGYHVLGWFGFANPGKLLKLASMLAPAIPMAVVGYKFGKLILGTIFLLGAIAIVIGIAVFVWQLL